MTEVDLATAKSHVQQFQEISQANEEALASLNATYDEFKLSTESQIARHEVCGIFCSLRLLRTHTVSQSEQKALEEKLQIAHDELVQLTARYNELQKTFDTERSAWTTDKKQLEDTIVDMSTSEKHSEHDRSSREAEVRQQEERAKVYY